MAMLQPKLAILDETDSGLDIDAIRIVANGVNKLRNKDNAYLLLRTTSVCWIISFLILCMYYIMDVL